MSTPGCERGETSKATAAPAPAVHSSTNPATLPPAGSRLRRPSPSATARRWAFDSSTTTSAPAVAADRARTDRDGELEELAADTLGAPERVLARHGGDQLPNLGTQSRPAQLMA